MFNGFNLRIDCFIDSNEKKIGHFFNDIEIKGIDFLKDYEGVLFIAVADHDEEISKSIVSTNPSLLANAYFLSEFKKDCAEMYDRG